MSKRFLLLATIALLLAPFVHAQVFTLPVAGCPMAHCDVRLSDRVNLAPPGGPKVAIISHDTIPTGAGNPFAPPGANQGIGCVSNGRMAACSYNNNFGGNIVAYTPTGTRLWDSGNLLDAYSFASAPMIAKTGDVIAADDTRVIRFSSTGSVVWNTPTPGGIPISPVLTSSGAVIIATHGGPISAFDNVSGRLIGSLYVRPDGLSEQYFDTLNTPCVVNNRFYVSMQLTDDPAKTARLVAIDYDPANPAVPLRVAWFVPFGGPGGASPTCIGNAIYFDGGSLNPGDPPNPQIFAVRDDGASGTLVWSRTVPAPVPASVSVDPRGGFWVEYTGVRSIQRRSAGNGAVLDTIDVSSLIGDPIINLPRTVLTMAGTSTSPVLIIGTQSAALDSAYVAAIDLTTDTLLWKKNLNPSLGSDSAPVQFPIAQTAAGKPIVIFAGRTSGAYFLADR